MEPHLAFVRSPVWDQAEESTKDAFRELISAIEERVDIVELPAGFSEAHEVHRRIMEPDLARSFAKEYRDGKDKLSKVLCEMIERGQQVPAVEYNDAVEQVELIRVDCAQYVIAHRVGNLHSTAQSFPEKPDLVDHFLRPADDRPNWSAQTL